MALGPRSREKLTDKIPPVRLTSDERQAIDWMAKRMARKAGANVEFTLSDMVRAVLADALRREVEEAEQAEEAIPAVVRRVM